MKCPQCNGLNDRVANNRHKENHTVVRRRRECLDCGHRWTTYEFMAESLKKKEDNDMMKFLGEDDG
jgi:transcriptional repressor NrdR